MDLHSETSALSDTDSADDSQFELTEIEARVVACVVEKSITTPNNYPLTLNSITNAANQKSSRDPVMQLTEGEVGRALNSLLDKKLVSREDGSRTTKWRHQFGHHFLLKPPMTAVLAAAILRGPQTLAELRSHAQPMRGPDDAQAMDEVIERLTDRATPLLRLLPREPGQSVQRYVHTLAPVVVGPSTKVSRTADRPSSSTEQSALMQRIDALERQVAALQTRLDALESAG